MATQHQIEELKRAWIEDPCYDLENADGFAEHRAELLAWRLEYRAINAKAAELGVPGNTALATYVIALEKRLDELAQRIETAPLVLR